MKYKDELFKNTLQIACATVKCIIKHKSHSSPLIKWGSIIFRIKSRNVFKKAAEIIDEPFFFVHVKNVFSLSSLKTTKLT